MQLLQERQVEPRPGDLVFRQSRRHAGATAAAFGGIAGAIAGAIAAGWLPGLFWFSVAIIGFVALLALGQFRAALRPSNWIVIARDDQVLVKFRSYQNHHFDPDVPTVMAIDHRELAAARVRRQQMETSMGDGTTKWTQVDVELRFVNEHTDELVRSIDEERRRTAPPGIVTSYSRHAPVSLPRPDVLRIAWRGRSDRVAPDAEMLLAHLPPSVATDAVEVDRTTDHLSDDAIDALVLDLAESGAVLDAVRILRERYGYDLTEAKQFVDQLHDAPTSADAAA